MESKGLEDFIKYLKNRTYDLSVRAKLEVSLSVFIVLNGNRQLLLKNKDRKILSTLALQVFEIKPERVEVELEFNGKVESHFLNMNYSSSSEHFQENHDNYRGTNVINEKYRGFNENNEIMGMAGVGNMSQVNIESIVNKRLEEERKERELTELKRKVSEYNDSLEKNNKEIEKLHSKIENKEQEIEALQKTIATKSNFKYYAGITGDILQSFGIKKEIIATPLAGILTGGNNDETNTIEQKVNDDDSGIIEDEQPKPQAPQSSLSNKRAEMIALISEYLQGIDNRTLSNVFTIFSEIENDPNNSELILKFLRNNK
jgi:antitoxin component of MazEF toxin-antitoxin module